MCIPQNESVSNEAKPPADKSGGESVSQEVAANSLSPPAPTTSAADKVTAGTIPSQSNPSPTTQGMQYMYVQCIYSQYHICI